MKSHGIRLGWDDPTGSGEVEKLRKYIDLLDVFLEDITHREPYMTKTRRSHANRKPRGYTDHVADERNVSIVEETDLPLEIDKLDRVAFGSKSVAIPDPDYFEE